MNMHAFLRDMPAELIEHIIPASRVLLVCMSSKKLRDVVATTKCRLDLRPGKDVRYAYADVNSTSAERHALVRMFVRKCIQTSLSRFAIRSFTMHAMVINNVDGLTALLRLSTRLEILDLYNNHIPEDDMCDMFCAVPPSLLVLRLARQWITRATTGPLCVLLARLVLLKELDLRENYLNSQGMQALTASIVSTQLTRVHLGFNHLKSRFWNEHPMLGFDRFVLHTLDLQHNMLQGSHCDSLYSCVSGSAGLLQALDVSYNDLRLLGISYLSRALQHCHALRHLNIAGNMCGDAALALLLSAVRPHVPGDDSATGIALQTFDVGNNKLTAASARLFSRCLAGNVALQNSLCNVSFSYNDLQDVGAQVIIEAIMACSIRKLGLAQCAMGEASGLCLAGTMPHWPMLACLDIHGNRLCSMSLILIAKAISRNEIHEKEMLFFGNWLMQDSFNEMDAILAATDARTNVRRVPFLHRVTLDGPVRV